MVMSYYYLNDVSNRMFNVWHLKITGTWAWNMKILINFILVLIDKGLLCSYAYHHWSCEFESRSGEVCSIQHYVIKFVSNLWQVQWFSPGTLVSSNNKTDRHNIAEILLKVALNTITLTFMIKMPIYYPCLYVHPTLVSTQ